VVTAIALAACVACSGEGGSTATSSSAEPPATTGVTASAAAAVTTTLPATSTTLGNTAHIEETLTAEQVAAELTAVERAAASGDPAVGVRQQLLYRYLSGHADFDGAVLAGVGDDVRPAVERIVRARQFSQQRAAANTNPTPPSETLPAWTIVEPAPIGELLDDYQTAEATTGVNWYWLAAIHLQETRMGRIIGTSSAGAVGPMQFLPSTWRQCCTGDPTVTRDAIIGAATYLAQHGAPGDMPTALHAYNPSDPYVMTVTAFAENLRDNPKLLDVYRQWQVFYGTTAGTVRLPIGYSQAEPVPAANYLAGHPEDAAS
jgi:membrane-bound lytic murein transglycosylase B